MAIDITSNEMLMLALQPKLALALYQTLQDLLEELKSIIQDEVYSYELNGDWQNRTYQFLNSWDVTDVSVVNGWYEASINQSGFDGWTVGTGRDMWSHDDDLANGSDASLIDIKYLDNIIENGIGEEHYGFPAMYKRPFWELFERYCVVNIDRIFYEKCLSNGVPIQKAVRFTDV